MTTISEDRKKIANYLLNAFGNKREKVNVNRYYDEAEKSSIDMISCVNHPNPGQVTYSTIGLSDYSIGVTTNNKQLRIEIIGGAKEDYIFMPNILSTCAFYIINNHYTCYPGAIFKDIIKMYDSNSKLNNLLMVILHMWGDKLKDFTTSQGIVTFLMAIPISESEKEYVLNHGIEALEVLFEEKEMDLYDIYRKSVV